MKKTTFLKHLVFIMLILFACSEVVSLLFIRDVSSGLFFSLFVIGGLLFPGMAILTALNPPVKKITEWFGLAFFLGYCADFLIYFVVVLGNLRSYTWAVILGIFLISCIFLWKKLSFVVEKLSSDVTGWKIIAVTGFAMFAVSLICYCGRNILPIQSGESGVTGDLLYWTGNTIELTWEFPPLNFRRYPISYSYHYFSSLQLALVSLATGIRPIFLSVSFTIVQSIVLRTFAGYVFLSACKVSQKRLWAGMLLLFFATGIEPWSFVYYMGHMYAAGFGFEYGLAGFLFLLYFLVCLHERGFDWKTYVIFLLSFFITFGLKVPFACVAICGIGVICIGWIFEKKRKIALLIGLPSLLLFFVAYRFVANLRGYGGGTSPFNTYQPMYQTYMSDFYQKLLAVLKTDLLSLPILYLCFFFVVSPVCLAMCVVLIIRLTRQKKWEAIDAAFAVMVLSGYVVTIQFTMGGLSNMYFAMSSFPAAIGWYFYRSELKRNKTGEILVLLSGIFSVCCFGYMTMRSAQAALGNYSKEIGYRNYEAAGYINADLWEAYTWVHEHTDEREFTVSNRTILSTGPFTETYVLEYDENSRLFSAETLEEKESVIQDYRKEGVRYIVYDIAFTPDFDMPEGMCEIAFQNDSTIVYTIP